MKVAIKAMKAPKAMGKAKEKKPPAKAKAAAKSSSSASSSSSSSSSAAAKPKVKAASKSKESAKAVSKVVGGFDYGSNHRHHCDGGGRFKTFYVSDDGEEIHCGNKQAHAMGMTFSTHGRYCCCNAVFECEEITFKPEPSNPYDRNAIEILGSSGDGAYDREELGYVPREWTGFVHSLLKDKRITVSGEKTCGGLLNIDIVITGPQKALDDYEDAEDEDSDDEFGCGY